MSVKRSGLGKNLSALLGSPRVSEGSDTTMLERPNNRTKTQIDKIPLESLVPGKYQPRRVMDEENIQELANSIKQQGLLQPILVRKLADGRYEIIAGERRFRALQLAGLSEVPVVLHQVDDETAMAIALVENLQREDLNPIDQARAMARLVNEFSLTHQEIALLLSKSRAAVSNFLRLLSLSEEVITLVENGALDMGHARALLGLDRDQQLLVAHHIIAKNLSVRNTEDFVGSLKDNKRPIKNPALPLCPPKLQLKIDSLRERLQTKIHLKQDKDGKGSLIIHYDSLQSLESIITNMALQSSPSN